MKGPFRRGASACAIVTLLGVALPAQAGFMDFLFGKRAETSAAQGRRHWQISEFTAIELVARESGAPANEHPAQIEPDTLRQRLSLARLQTKAGREALFAPDELAELAVPLSQALAAARPEDDVLLLSTHRRGAGYFTPPLGLTARVFVQGGRLNLIVREARQDFMNAWRGGRIQPDFQFGSRALQSPVVLDGSDTRRADWLQLGLGPVAAAPAAPATPAVAPLPAPAAPAARADTPATAPRDAAYYEQQELRLRALKRLRDGNLITEEEYQQKRREILNAL